MRPATPVLDVRPARPDDEAEIRSLLTHAMGHGPTGRRTADFFRWKHQDNPFGKSPGLVAVHEGRVVGVRLFLRWQFRVGSRTLSAVRAVDTATHPGYQRQGIFSRLTMDLLERVEREDGVELVFNTPNADSKPAYLRLGWQVVGQLPVHISPVRPWAFARGLAGARAANSSGTARAVAEPRSAASPIESSLPPAADAFREGTALAELLSEHVSLARLHTPLTVEYLRWRYAEAPDLDYRCVPVQHQGRLVGVGFGRLRRRAGLAELTLGNVIVRPGDRRSAARVLRAARRSGADHVAVHATPGSDLVAVTARSGYFPAPRQGICLLANPRTALPRDVLDPKSWSLALGDLEVF